jgi:DNA-binding XRE family transcriptional regulator
VPLWAIRSGEEDLQRWGPLPPGFSSGVPEVGPHSTNHPLIPALWSQHGPHPAGRRLFTTEVVTWARKKAGLTQRALALAVGVSEQLMSEIGSAWRSATPTNLAKIAETLNCPLVALERKRS